MDAWRALPEDQRKMIQAIRSSTQTIVEIAESLGVKRWRLSRWFNNEQFKKLLKVAMRETRTMGDAELTRAYRTAVQKLSQMVEKTIPFDADRVALCRAVIEVHQRRRSPVRRKSPPSRKSQSTSPRLHPSHAQKDATELIRSLYALHAAETTGPGECEASVEEKGASDEEAAN